MAVGLQPADDIGLVGRTTSAITSSTPTSAAIVRAVRSLSPVNRLDG